MKKPLSFHSPHRQRAAASLLHVRTTATYLHVGCSRPCVQKQTLCVMNVYFCFTVNVLSSIQCGQGQGNIRCGRQTAPLSDIRGRWGRASINIFFLKTATQRTMNWGPFQRSLSRIRVKWGENKQTQRDGLAGSLAWMSAEVCLGDPDKSAFEGSQGRIQLTGKQTQPQISTPVYGSACQSWSCHFPPSCLPGFYHVFPCLVAMR